METFPLFVRGFESTCGQGYGLATAVVNLFEISSRIGPTSPIGPIGPYTTYGTNATWDLGLKDLDLGNIREW